MRFHHAQHPVSMSLTLKTARLALALITLVLTGLLPAAGQQLNTLHSFTGTDGNGPAAGLIQASDGNLYGTAMYGGANGLGTIFKITPSGSFTTLYSFTGGSDGYHPRAGLIQASDGDLYGTTYGATSPPYNSGTIFKITLSGAFTTLYSFTALNAWGVNADGANPYAGLIQASDGNLYGTAMYGGANGLGTIFKITPSGSFTTLYSFSNKDLSGYPYSLIQASDGNFYGTAALGGGDSGSIFRITPSGFLTTLYSFFSGTWKGVYFYNYDGAYASELIQASDGNLYGTTTEGGANAAGTIFRITLSGSFTKLHDFSKVLGGNYMSQAGLIQASDGNLYGTTYRCGPNGTGTIFKITPSGSFTTLYNFSALNSSNENADGAFSIAPLIQASDGNLYGTAYQGGTNGMGTVFSISPNAPILTSLSPTYANAGGPAFTLKLNGNQFASNSQVLWNGTALSTSFVSATQLKAWVPAGLIANVGTAQVIVSTPGAGTSNSIAFPIVVTTLNLVAATLTRNSSTGEITAVETIQNAGHLTASNVTLTQAAIFGRANTTTSLPINLGSLAPGSAVKVTLTYPGSAGASGTKAYLTAVGIFTGGTFDTHLRVTLP